MIDDCRHRDDAGPWVLGALAEEDARAFAEHLESCPICRLEVAELQVVADVLPMAAPQLVPPPALKSRIMGVVESEAQLLRAAGPEADRPAAVLATALLALGVVAGVLLSGGEDTTSHPGFGPKGAQVALRVTGEHGVLDLRGMPAAPSGRVYQVWLVHGKDKPRPTHTLFTVPSDGRARVEIMESLKGTDQVLVTTEPPGGSEQPTSAPLMGASLT